MCSVFGGDAQEVNSIIIIFYDVKIIYIFPKHFFSTLAIMKLKLTQAVVISFEVSSKNKYFTARFQSNVILHKHYLIYMNYWFTIFRSRHPSSSYMSLPVAISVE